MTELHSELQAIQDFLEEPTVDDPDMIIERTNELCQYLARTGKIQADAELEYNKAVSEEVKDIIRKMVLGLGASHTAANALIKSAGHRQRHVLTWAERLNRTCVHQLDWARTIISKAKEEMRMNQFGGGGR